MSSFAFRMFKIDWRLKTAAFRFFETFPLGEQLYFFTQRNITRTYPRLLKPTNLTARRFVEHAETIRRHIGSDLRDARLFEFGAGWDLYSNIVMWCYGIQHQTVFDLRRWARPKLVNGVIRHLRADPPPGAQRVPSSVLRDGTDFCKDLLDRYGVDYHAPSDARETGLPAGSVDIVVTTSVLEHVPETQIRRLMAECRRLMHANAVASHVIDYSDHYAHSDARIGPYNFLQFSEEEWKRFNPDIHYQNRMRHLEYARIFRESGFSIEEEYGETPENAEVLLRSISLARPFANYTSEELKPLVGRYVLRKT